MEGFAGFVMGQTESSMPQALAMMHPHPGPPRDDFSMGHRDTSLPAPSSLDRLLKKLMPEFIRDPCSSREKKCQLPLILLLILALFGPI